MNDRNRGNRKPGTQRNRTVGARRWVEPISHNRSLPSRVQFQHFPGIKTRNRSFEGDDQFSAVSVGSAAQAVFQSAPSISKTACLTPRINLKMTAGFVGIFIPEPDETAQNKAASHFQEDFMANLWSTCCSGHYVELHLTGSCRLGWTYEHR